MTDALSRKSIQRWTAQLVPPEYLGAHVSAEVSHQSGRRVPLAFRSATAFFGHLGVERELSAAPTGSVRSSPVGVELHKAHRALLHSGRVVRADHADAGVWVHGVVAPDRSSAVIAVVQMETSAHGRPAPVRVPWLDAGRSYRVTRIDPHERAAHANSPVVLLDLRAD
jgi:alpha-galactosidase